MKPKGKYKLRSFGSPKEAARRSFRRQMEGPDPVGGGCAHAPRRFSAAMRNGEILGKYQTNQRRIRTGEDVISSNFIFEGEEGGLGFRFVNGKGLQEVPASASDNKRPSPRFGRLAVRRLGATSAKKLGARCTRRHHRGILPRKEEGHRRRKQAGRRKASRLLMGGPDFLKAPSAVGRLD